jgi:penicillin-binding protein 1A
LKKSALLLPLTTLGTAAFMVGFLCAGYLIIQTSVTLPDAQSIKGVELKIPLRVYSSEGLLISEFGNERRKPALIEDVPQALIDAVLASEDDGFYEHQGIDITGLFRAALSNFSSGQTQQGASTITMQVAKNFFLSREKTYTRKLKEVLLAIKLEQILGKNEILSLYLNKIFLGHRAYGFGAAADVYYGRELNQLSLAETAMLAGLPKAPSTYNPLRNPRRAMIRRNYVLGRLKDLGKIDLETYTREIAAPITAKIHSRNTQLDAPHIAEMVRAKLIEELGEQAYWGGLNVHTTIRADKQLAAEQALRAGLQSYDRRHGFRGPISKADPSKFNKEARHRINEDDSEVIAIEDQYAELLSPFPKSREQQPALVISSEELSATVFSREYGEVQLELADARWARRHLTTNRLGDAPKSMTELVSPGDIIYIQPIVNQATASKQDVADQSNGEIRWQLSQIPNISGALISIEPSSGRILSLVGGYDFFLNKFNRAIQSIRQPGSNIKPFIYSASLNKGFTPATLISGAPIVITNPAHGTVWRPENYSGKFFGPTRMREALSKSLNLVSIRLLRAVGIPYTREYLQRFGIDMSRFSPTLTMALGSGGITPLEMLGAYGTLANTGYKVEPYFIDHITDRTGEIVYQAQVPTFCDECYADLLTTPSIDPTLLSDADFEPSEIVDEILEAEPEGAAFTDIEEVQASKTYDAPRVMTKANNFLLVSMLKDVVRRGTGRKALALNRQDLAGKTGTTNDYVDAWFTGFNSQVATTVWVGFDEPATMGKGEAGSVAALPIWVNYMRVALNNVPEDTQELPEWIEEGLVNRETGARTDELDPDAVVEYFPIEALLDYPLTELDQAQTDERQATQMLLDEIAELDVDAVTALDSVDTPDPLEPNDELYQDLEAAPPIEVAPRIIEQEIDTEGLF